MHLLSRHDRAHRIERGHDARAAIILERRLAHLGSGIAPRDREDGEPLADQMIDERVLGPQVEDVVFHDPGRHDQDRLGLHLVRLRGVLQELEKCVAEHDLAGRHRQRLAHDKGGLEGRPGAAQSRRDVEREHRDAVHQVGAPRRTGGGDNLGVERGEVRRRNRVEHLPRHEGDPVDIAPLGAPHRRGRGPPPVVHREEALREQVERIALPARIGETMIGRTR